MTEQRTVIKMNPMRKIKIEKVILSAGATGNDLEKSKTLLEYISNKKPHKIASTKRIPNFGVRPGLEVGCRVTIRGKDAITLLDRLLKSLNNILDEDSVANNAFSFGIKEYIEVPGAEYKREIGIRGFIVTVVFIRPGFRVKRKKYKSSSIPKKQIIKPEEIIKYMEENFNTKFE